MMAALNFLLNQPWPYLAFAALSAVMGWYAWKHTHRPDTRYFQWITVIWVAYELNAALLAIAHTMQARYGLWLLLSILTIILGPMELMVVLEYTGNEKWLGRRVLNLLILPALLFAAAGLVMPDFVSTVEVHSGYPIIVGQSPVKWGFFGYIAFLLFIRIIVLFDCLLHASAFRAPVLLLILSQTVPLAAYLAIDPAGLTTSQIAVTPLFGVFNLLSYFVALYGFRFLQVIPVARDQVIAHLPYSLLVLDAESRLVDFNASAQSLPGLAGKLSLHLPGQRALAEWWERLAPLIGPQPVAQDVIVPDHQVPRIFHIVSLPLLQASGWRMGQVILLEDVTQARQEQRMMGMLREREQLARELHDSIGQVLGFTSLKLGAARKLISDGRLAEAGEHLAHTESIMIDAHADLREYILNLRNTPTDDKPFFSALRQYLDGYRQNYGIQVDVSIEASEEAYRFAPDAQLQLFRILQEALSNARKHAQSDCVKIFFEKDGSLVHMRIEDNGKGFDPRRTLEKGEGHFGLQIMKERAECLGGSLRLQSAPGEGTCIEVEIPCAC